ncbi:MAG: caspase family protein [Fimbriimonadaceae bacterium]|nr:caspase family protein [Fimbriimonadaceae bacterium]
MLTTPVQQTGKLAVETVVGKRVALVIGNSEYLYGGRLKNPVNDAADMAALLKRIGFEVILYPNANRERMLKALGEFKKSAADANIALVYFSGHGIQSNGENFLIPVDAKIDEESMLPYHAINLSTIFTHMTEKRSRPNLVILDACRDNPFRKSFRSGRSGLATPHAPDNTLISFATAPGSVASDNIAGRNGLFTTALLSEFVTPGAKVEDVFKSTRKRVADASKMKQVPWENSSLLVDVVLVPTKSPTPLPPNPEPEPAPKPEPLPNPNPTPHPELNAVNLRKLGDIAYAQNDFPTALAHYESAAKLGDASASNLIGNMHALGKGVPVSFPEALRWYRRSADAGFAPAMDNLGTMYEYGYGVTFDYVQALNWYRKASELGNVSAMLSLAHCLEYGHGVPHDYAEARKWLLKAAELGSPIAEYGLGRHSEHGLGTERDDQEALNRYRVSAEQGYVPAMLQTGLMYQDGRGTPQSYEQAYRWYSKAAELGDPVAMYRIGTYYQFGFHVERDYAQSLTWLRKAADRGNAAAMFHLGAHYENGYGVTRDLDAARGWYTRAADKGNDDARDAFKRVKQ